MEPGTPRHNSLASPFPLYFNQEWSMMHAEHGAAVPPQSTHQTTLSNTSLRLIRNWLRYNQQHNKAVLWPTMWI
eukprot:252363-Ditylum_brightwellii.AAC.1